jgi:hypothetical protein
MSCSVEIFTIVGLISSFLAIFFIFRKRRLSRSVYLVKKAKLYYRSKKYNKAVVLLEKAFMDQKKGLITKEEAFCNLINLELLDLILLKKDIDSDNLTLPLRRYFNHIEGITRVDQGYFQPIQIFYNQYTNDFNMTQEIVNAIAKNDFQLVKKRQRTTFFTVESSVKSSLAFA